MTSLHSSWLCGALVLLGSSCLTAVNDTPLGKLDGGNTGGGAAMTGGGASTGGGGATGGGTATGGGNTTGGGGGSSSSVTCTSDGFCWERAPFGGSFHAVGGFGPNFVVAVGEGGVIARFDGTSWSYVRTNSGRTLRGVWFESATRGWAVGDDGMILEWNGSTWSHLTSPTMRNLVSIHGAGDVVYVGGLETVLKRNATAGTFEVVPNVLPVTDAQPTVRALHVVSATEVYVGGGYYPFLRRFDGTQWTDLLDNSGPAPTGSDTPYSLSVCGGNLFVTGS